MTSKLKLYLGRKVIESLRHKTNVLPEQLKPLIQIGISKSENDIEMSFPLNALETSLGISNINEVLKIQPDDIIKNIHCIKDSANRRISFEINKNIFIKDVIENCTIPEVNYRPKNLVVEYSSPNIAKPFHVGHLRSTIIGNFVANINNYLKNKVTRINYLGDWGTQFGYVKVGVDKLNYSKEQIKQNPMKILYESYVHANNLAKSDPQISELARNQFVNLEKGIGHDLDNWREYVNYSINELEITYNRLGIKFDEYNFESMYKVKEIQNVISILRQKNLLKVERDGKQTTQVNNRDIVLIKSDGSTLYLTRDIAAAIDRFSKHKFDQMYYVVENGQNDHFNALKSILLKMGLEWAENIHHVKFGRIRGMSTRRGNVVFLKDILDEARERMMKRQIESPTTKAPITDGHISDNLGISCVIVNDLKQRRQKDYNFTWDKVLQVQGDTGIKLQYTHCRLYSLERNCGVIPAQECIPEVLDQPEVLELVRELGRFHDVLYSSHQQLEACVLVTYLFHLCHYINRALKTLQVKDQEEELASQRLLIFHNARIVLHQGMSILGITPLNEM